MHTLCYTFDTFYLKISFYYYLINAIFVVFYFCCCDAFFDLKKVLCDRYAAPHYIEVCVCMYVSVCM